MSRSDPPATVPHAGSTPSARRRWSSAFALILSSGAVVLAPMFTGCASDPTQGYSGASTHPGGISTVAVPIFENDTFTRDVEFQLAAALINEVEVRTPYKVVPRRRADTILSGRIRKIELDQLSKSPLTGLSEEMIVSLTVDFEWKDLRSDKRLVERRSFTSSRMFVPSRPTSEPIELGQFAAVQQLARQIVDEMRADW